MQKCYNCGREVDDNVLICPECGALVKRYGKPAPMQPEPEAAPQYPQTGRPGVHDAPDRPAARESVWLDGKGKPHFNGGICFWLIVCAVYAGYMFFGFCCILLVYHAQSFFLDTLAAFPEYADMAGLLQTLLESVGENYGFYVVTLCLFALKLAGIIWLLLSRRRLSFYAAAGVSVLLVVMSLLFGGGMQAILYAADMLITFLLLRKRWSTLRP